MIRPNRRVRQGCVPAKNLVNFLACFGGEIRLSDQSDDPMAFVQPSEGRRSCQQIEQQKS
jgi:hypothetical protein